MATTVLVVLNSARKELFLQTWFSYSLYLKGSSACINHFQFGQSWPLSTALLETATRWAPVAHSNWSSYSAFLSVGLCSGKYQSMYLTFWWGFAPLQHQDLVTLTKSPRVQSTKVFMVRTLASELTATISLLQTPYFSEGNSSQALPPRLPCCQLLAATTSCQE